jgi:hypothetical protein
MTSHPPRARQPVATVDSVEIIEQSENGYHQPGMLGLPVSPADRIIRPAHGLRSSSI